MSPHPEVISVAERIIAVDPARVWSLLGDPERVDEWVGRRVVGYLGTELPKPGQSLFIRRRLPGAEPYRVEIERWEAGEKIRCVVHREPAPITYEIFIHPEVQPDKIATRVRLTQRTPLPPMAHPAGRWWVERRLERQLDRITEVAAS